MAGLDIKHFDDGGSTGEAAPSPAAIQATMDKSGKTSVAGKIALDPTQTEAILSNMQKYIDERSGGWNQFMGGINRAYATTYGPSALNAYDQQKMQEDKQIMDYRTQMAAYRAAQSQAVGDEARFKNITTPSTGGAENSQISSAILNDPDIKRRLSLARTYAEKNAIIDEASKKEFENSSKARYDAASNTPQEYMLPPYGPIKMTPNQWRTMSPDVKAKMEKAFIAQFGEVPPVLTGAAPSAAPSATAPATGNMTPVAAVRTIESNNNPNVGASSKGALGAMQVLPTTAKDPGFGVKPVQNNSPEEMERLGRDYYGAMQKRYKDDITAAIAYNWGPGNTDKWLASGADPAKLPSETRNYITKFKGLVGAPAQTAVNKLELPDRPDNFPVTQGEWNKPKPNPATGAIPDNFPVTQGEWNQPKPAMASAPTAAPMTTAPAAVAPAPVASPVFLTLLPWRSSFQY